MTMPLESERVRSIIATQSAHERRQKLRGILWEGQSPLNGAPIVAIATPTVNRKTGPMVQVWILRSDISPMDAIRMGNDTAVCGHCPMRSRDGFAGRGCYVNVAHAPRVVWEAYRAGRYPRIGTEAFVGRMVRWGAYGDPAMLPEQLVRDVNAVALGWTGYTHQWAYPWAQWTRGILMASVETPRQEAALYAKGWGTFRAGAPDGSDAGKATLCENERTGELCIDCKRCDGRRARIYIPSHGTGKNFVPAVRLVRRKEET